MKAIIEIDLSKALEDSINDSISQYLEDVAVPFFSNLGDYVVPGQEYDIMDVKDDEPIKVGIFKIVQ